MSGSEPSAAVESSESAGTQPRSVAEQARALAADRPFLSRGLVVLVMVVALGFVVYELRGVLTPIFTALGIAYLLDPVVDRFEARGLDRGIGITIVLTLLALAVALFSLLVLPGVIHEVSQFLSELPGELLELVRQLEPVLEQYNIPVPHSVNEALEQFELDPATVASHAAQPVEAMLRGVLGGTASAVGAIASALIVPVLAFYLLYDFDRMIAGARDLVPVRMRPQVVEVAVEIDEMLGQFVRGQLLVMIAMAVLYGVAYSLVGVRLAIPIALIAGLLAFIPYVGSGSALMMGLLMCVVDWDGWLRPLLVVVAYGVCQFLEGFVIVPRVVGDKVGLPAVWVLVALMIGGDVFGFLGVLLAVPTAAVVKIFVVRGIAWYKKSHYYLGDTAVPEGARVAVGGVELAAPPREAPSASPAVSDTTEAAGASGGEASVASPSVAEATPPPASNAAETTSPRDEGSDA
jgi:predicted PurR-regulated permease PerM